MRKILLAALALLTITGSGFAQNLPSYVPANGLVGWWPFNGNANDESGNGNNGTVNGATLTADRFGNAGKAYNFNGSADNQDYILMNNPISNQDVFTINYWFKVSDGNPRWQLMILGNSVLPGSYELFSNNDTVYFRNWGSSNGLNFDLKQKVPNNNQEYINICAISDLASNKLYINGVLSQENSFEKVKAFEGTFHVGKHPNFQSSTNTSFLGSIDDIAIYNRALTQQEITALYQGGNTTANCLDLPSNLQQGLVGYWPFCGNANDESGNGNNGTVNGATLTTDRFGNQGSAYSFDGASNISVNSTTALCLQNQFTISLWASRNNSSPMGLVGKLRDGQGGGSYHISGDGTTQGIGINNDQGGCSTCNIASVGPLTNTSGWNLFTGTWDGVRLKFFQNGILLSDVNGVLGNGNSLLNFNAPLIFGQYLSNYYNGKLDDIAIWNRALTPQEITQLYYQNICTQSITVTDTLLIHTTVTSWNPVKYANTLKVWPNPASPEPATSITLDAGNLSSMAGWKYKVTSNTGVAVVAETPIIQQQQIIPISSWGPYGVYFIYLIDANNIIQEVKKIVLAP